MLQVVLSALQAMFLFRLQVVVRTRALWISAQSETCQVLLQISPKLWLQSMYQQVLALSPLELYQIPTE